MAASTVAPGVTPVGEDFSFRPNYFAEGLYASTDVIKGVTRNRAGTRIIALSEDFLLGMRRVLIDECGAAADSVAHSIGKKWGRLFAQRFSREMNDYYGRPINEFPLAVFHACLIELFSHHGWGRIRLEWERKDVGIIGVAVDSALMSTLVRDAAAPVDAMLAGVLAGFFSDLSGEDLECAQTQCLACGAAESRFVLALASRLAGAEQWTRDRLNHEEIVEKLVAVRV